MLFFVYGFGHCGGLITRTHETNISGTAHNFARSALKLVLLDSHKTYHI